MNNDFYIGIDPGLSGALAVLDASGTLVSVSDTPVISVVQKGKKSKSGGAMHKKHYMVGSMVQLLRLAQDQGNVQMIGLEQVSARPEQGVTSMFSMGRGVGTWEGIIGALGLTLDYITPQVWKKVFGLSGSDKADSILKAQQIIKGAVSYLTLVKHDGRAEACLIGEYTRRKCLGLLPAKVVTPRPKKIKTSSTQDLNRLDEILKTAESEDTNSLDSFI